MSYLVTFTETILNGKVHFCGVFSDKRKETKEGNFDFCEGSM